MLRFVLVNACWNHSNIKTISVATVINTCLCSSSRQRPSYCNCHRGPHHHRGHRGRRHRPVTGNAVFCWWVLQKKFRECRMFSNFPAWYFLFSLHICKTFFSNIKIFWTTLSLGKVILNDIFRKPCFHFLTILIWPST